MSAVELSPTLVSRLGLLESHVLDPSIAEVLVAGPNSIYLTRDGRSEKLDVRFDEASIRSLAARLVRSLSWRESRGTRSGLLTPDLHVNIVGAPRGDRCPVIRFVRRSIPKRTLSQLAQDGVLDRDAELRLLQACRNRRSIVISGHAGSGRTDLLAALARVWKEERRVAVLDTEGRLSAAEVGHVHLEPSAGAQAAMSIGAEVIITDDPQAPLWAQLLDFGRPFIATVEASDAQGALDRIVALWLQAKADASQLAGTALVETSVALVVEMERAHGRCTVRSIAEPQRANGHLSAKKLMSAPPPPPPLAPPPPAATRPTGAAAELRSFSIPKEQTQNFVVDGFGFETSDISEIRAESLMSASFVGRMPEVTPDVQPVPEELAAPKERSPSERVPTLIGRGEPSEDETHPPPDERTMHAEEVEMIEALSFDDKSYTAPATQGLDPQEGWGNDAPSEVTHGPSLEDEPDQTDSKEMYNERTPYSPFADQKKDSLTSEEIEGMLNELDDVVHLGDDDGPKAKRRTRKAR
jgi:Flp pilus assembly CpaF family ATPase